jgi:hypothetical protein
MVNLRGGTFVETRDGKGERVPDLNRSKLSQGFDENRLTGLRNEARSRNDGSAEKLDRVGVTGLDYSLQMQLALRRPGVTKPCFLEPAAGK